jgi:hypothetical protein
MKAEDYDLTKRLKATLLQYVKLYERWSEDRQEWTKKLAEVEEVYIQFETAVDKFDEVDKKFRASLKGFIVTESKNVADSVKESLQDTVNEVKQSINQTVKEVQEKIHTAVTDEVKKSITNLNDAVDKANYSLKETVRVYNQEVSWQFWKTMLATFIGGVVISIFMLIYFTKIMPKPVLPISDQQLEYLHVGQSLMAIWPKLSKAEQERVKKLAADAASYSV